MKNFDVFNGDADGICALQQLRLAEPKETVLVTGVKRDINLLKKVTAAAGDAVTVLDISLDKNRDDLLRLLQQGVSVRYFDHHFAGEIPESNLLQSFIDTEANICTCLLVNQYLEGAFLPWAVTGAFGDNLYTAAREAAAPLQLSEQELEQLRYLGTLINYNGYGASLDDLLFHPDDLYRTIKPYSDPFDFIRDDPACARLQQGYEKDIASAEAIKASYEDDAHAIYILPDEKWARRVSGVFANQLAQQYPDRAHAMLTEREGGYLVSVRAPLNNRTGADVLCRQFATGGGRKAAAGINHLSTKDFSLFREAFLEAF